MTDELAELEGKNEMNKMPGFTAEAALDRAHTHYSTAQFPRAQSEDGSGEIKAAQAGCTVLRPIGWNQFGVGCVEGPTTPIYLADGESYTAVSIRLFPFSGYGFTRVRCSNGRLITEASYCRKFLGYPF
jgi:hypothetical protein